MEHVNLWIQMITMIVTMLGAFAGFGTWIVRTLDRRTKELVQRETSALGIKMENEMATLGTRMETENSALGARIETETAALGRRIETETSALGARIEAETSALGARIEHQTAVLGARIDNLEIKIDGLDRLSNVRLTSVEADLQLIKQHLLGAPAA